MGRLFNSYIMGGFECSTHRTKSGKRLDLIAATKHDEFAEPDYRRLLSLGMNTARDGVRWHLIEKEPYRYDFSSLEKQLQAVQNTGIQIIWDLFHYGFPDDLDLFSPNFIERFARFCGATVKFIGNRINQTLFVCPVNEISFFSWAAGEVGIFYPYKKNCGDELKEQLIKASFAAIDAIRFVNPDVRFVQTDPAIHVTAPKKASPHHQRAAGKYRLSQFHALDMLCGKLKPELGGHAKYLDIIGLNYYFHNQWRYPSRRKIQRGHPEYRPLHNILEEFYERYQRPMFISETGMEDDLRADWFRYICEETRTASNLNIRIEGICLYPIVNHPGWDDNRHCHNGLWDYPDKNGEREIHQPLAEEILFRTRREHVIKFGN
jgi:beta-glucosidase/6-phospho-beta-glucosidase/beta-galactosidase